MIEKVQNWQWHNRKRRMTYLQTVHCCDFEQLLLHLETVNLALELQNELSLCMPL